MTRFLVQAACGYGLTPWAFRRHRSCARRPDLKTPSVRYACRAARGPPQRGQTPIIGSDPNNGVRLQHWGLTPLLVPDPVGHGLRNAWPARSSQLSWLCHAIGRADCPDERPRGREQKRASGKSSSRNKKRTKAEWMRYGMPWRCYNLLGAWRTIYVVNFKHILPSRQRFS